MARGYDDPELFCAGHASRRAPGKTVEQADADFIAYYEKAIRILSTDPYNLTRSYQVKKLANIAPGQGVWRLRLGRWRFRYDIWDQQVELSYCGLRREETYK